MAMRTLLVKTGLVELVSISIMCRAAKVLRILVELRSKPAQFWVVDTHYSGNKQLSPIRPTPIDVSWVPDRDYNGGD